jgi:hypothetical protein
MVLHSCSYFQSGTMLFSENGLQHGGFSFQYSILIISLSLKLWVELQVGKEGQRYIGEWSTRQTWSYFDGYCRSITQDGSQSCSWLGSSQNRAGILVNNPPLLPFHDLIQYQQCVKEINLLCKKNITYELSWDTKNRLWKSWNRDWQLKMVW